MNLSDVQVARVFQLCAEIDAVKRSLPAPPQGCDIFLEVAMNTRAVLAEHDAALRELADILAHAGQATK